MPITVVTGNPNKAAEVASILRVHNLPHVKLDLPEIQSFAVEEIVKAKAEAAFAILHSPVIVEDTHVAIDGLKGFPGPFVKYWESEVGWDHTVQHLVAEGPGRAMTVGACVAYKDEDNFFIIDHCVPGALVTRTEGKGWGFDYYFVPDGYTESFAQLGVEVKNRISHRANALMRLRDLLKEKELIT